MTSIGARARLTLIDLLCRAVAGRGVERAAVPDVQRDLRLSGFRKTARAQLLRCLARSAFRNGGMTILAPALDGRFRIFVAADDFGVGWEILEHGTYEPHVVSFYRATLRPGMRVLDIGANIGFHALHAASLVGPTGRVIAIEPDPRNTELLRRSVEAAGAAFPVEVVEAALSDAGGELVLSDLGNAANSGARFTHPDRAVLEDLVHGPRPSFRSVPAIRWDEEHEDTAIDLVKIDIEGNEPRAIRGMERAIGRHHPTVLTEFAPSNLASIGGVEPGDYLAWFEERGYRAAVLDEPSGTPVGATRDEILERARDRHHVDLVLT